jgi:hypothetical protein
MKNRSEDRIQTRTFGSRRMREESTTEKLNDAPDQRRQRVGRGRR